jgi:hypothetical protein
MSLRGPDAQGHVLLSAGASFSGYGRDDQRNGAALEARDDLELTMAEKQKPASRLVFAHSRMTWDLLGEAQHEINQLFDVGIGYTR